jgi:adenylate kinase family enzyme
VRAAGLTASLAATVSRVSAGSSSTRLIVLRGNSGSGKSSVAAEIRARYGRGIALVGQDNLRRVVLRERDVPGGANIGLIDTVTRYALCEFHVVVEGILRAAHYGPMLEALHRDHQSVARFYYLDVPLEETLRRHANRPQAAEFGEADMRAWYRERDLLPGGIEQIIPADSSLEDTVRLVMLEAGLAGNSLQPAAQP